MQAPTLSKARAAGWTSWLVLLPLLFLAVAVTHLTLLRLPFFWDEGGYYIPAALDFFHRGTLIPSFTNAHPPLPNILLGTLWRLTGFAILPTRLFVCLVAAAALLAVFRLADDLADRSTALAVTVLTATYPIWYAQSTLAHADIFAAAFTLAAFTLYFQRPQTLLVCHPDSELAERSDHHELPAASTPRFVAIAALFSLAALSKETAIIQPAALAALELTWLLRASTSEARRNHLSQLFALSFPLLPLLAWYAFHHARTGFTFGNPEYLRYNATANLTVTHFLHAFLWRFLHLTWQRNLWLPLVLACACRLLPRRNPGALSSNTLTAITILIAANWIAFSILGGALLTRYLLPVYPLILLVCVTEWRSRSKHWVLFTAVTATVFISAWWLNPPSSFAPEDNLTYRDMILVHQEAIAFLSAHFPDATVLTAWPVTADLSRPELGYTTLHFITEPLENFSLPEVRKAQTEPTRFDTALVFNSHYTSPAYARFLLAHPTSRRGAEFAAERDLNPEEVAALLGGHIVWKNDRNGEWAAVLRFDRSYDAVLTPPDSPSPLRYSTAFNPAP